MVDGDDTYDAKAVEFLLEPIFKGDADITVASRLGDFREQVISQFSHHWATNWYAASSIGCSNRTSMIFFPVTGRSRAKAAES